MNIDNLSSDEAVLTELGERIARQRIAMDLTQAALAEQAGISKRTIERLERGQSTQLVSLIRTLRVLQLLPNLEQLLPAARPGPMELLEHHGKTRRRASPGRGATTPSAWSWGKTLE